MHNTYFLMRHGRSELNDAEIINSSVESGTTENHLSEEGRKKAQMSIEESKEAYQLDASTIIVSSDFTRAKETAEIAQKVLGVPAIELCTNLRERFFGAFDDTSTSNFEKIWQAEQEHSSLIKECEVESVDEIQKRVLACVDDLENRYLGKNIFLVSHADTLQVLQVSLQQMSPNQYRSVAPIQNAEIRKIP